MSLFLMLLFILIPVKINIKEKNKKIINNKTIYLIDKENYTSLVNVYYDENDIVDEIKKKIDILKNGTKNFDGVIPKNTKLENVKIDKNNIYLNFDKNFLKSKNIKKIYECITYSLCEINGVDNIYISVNNKLLDGMPINKNIGINNEYNLNSFNHVDKTIIFFAKDDYYVPITKYTNDKDEKIKIIIKELKSSVNSLNNLVGYLTDDIELTDYKINDKKIELVFNKFIFSDDRIKFLISSSVFANYDTDELVIYNNDKSIKISIKNNS